MKLLISPLPESTWGKSLANLLPKDVWDKLRKEIYRDSDFTCSICDADDIRLHAHEVWDFDDYKRIQRLLNIICVCEDCHNVIHYFRTLAECLKGKIPRSYLEKLERHFCVVNDCSGADFDLHRAAVMLLQQKRCRRKWTIDWGLFEPGKIIEIARKQ